MQSRPIFRPSFGNRPDRIVGRESEMMQLIDGLASYPGTRGRASIVIGQRGTGKTALLLEVAEKALEMNYVIARTTCGDAMLDNIIDSLQIAGSSYVDRHTPPIKGFSAGAFGFSMGLTFTDEARTSFGFRTKLGMICERLAEAGKGVLIVVDEVRPDVGPMRDLATAYQELVGLESNIAIVMAGLPSAISNLLGQKTLTFLERANKIRLTPVSVAAIAAYYSSVFDREGIQVDDEVLRQAAQATDGYPYLLQLIGYYLTEYATHDEITSHTLDRAKTAAIADLNDNVIGAVLRPLSQGDLAFLRAMAWDEGATRVRDLESRLGVSQGHVQSYRRRLMDAGVIYAPRRGELDYAVPYLRAYLREQ